MYDIDSSDRFTQVGQALVRVGQAEVTPEALQPLRQRR